MLRRFVNIIMFMLGFGVCHAQTITKHEYWFDDDYPSKQENRNSSNDINLSVDISKLTFGLHYLNFRAINSNGEYGNINRFAFYYNYLPSTDVKISFYEYWLDNDLSSRKTVKSSQTDQVFSVDVSKLPEGLHFLNYRAVNTDGEIGTIDRFMFYMQNKTNSGDSPIVGYQYSFNNNSTYVPIAETFQFEMANKTFSIPDLLDIATIDSNSNFIFNAEDVSLSRTTTVNFALQFVNKDGDWSEPATYSYTEDDNITRKAETLNVQSSIIVDKVKNGDFKALSMNIPNSSTYYLCSSQPCNLAIYDASGKLITTISKENMINTYSIGLAPGKYYGILYNTVKDNTYADEQIGVRLMLTDKFVSTPKISYNNEIVSIACSQEGAKIYYTLDGTEPSKNSSLYNTPFELKQNAIIKAIATYSNYENSYVATYKVDGYKVCKPEINFANLKVYLTCSTTNSKIYYTLDNSDPLVNGILYTEPINIAKNCKVRVIARRDNYHNSEENSLDIDLTNVTCATPSIAVANNILTITSLTSGCKIYYTTDGTSPSTSSNLYTSPVKLTHNCIVRAIAVKENYINSPVKDYNVDWFTVEKPAIKKDKDIVTISCIPAEATIYYTIDGKEPTKESYLYKEPFKLDYNTTVKAFGMLANFNDSPVETFVIDTYKVDKPSVDYADQYIYISCTTANSKIYYTKDGTDPLKTGIIYKEPIYVSGSCTIRAIAKRDNYYDSDEVVYNFDINNVTCATPSIAVANNILTITSLTSGCKIYYTTDGASPSTSSNLYTSPVKLTHNCIVRAIAVKENYINSPVKDYVVDSFFAEKPQMTLNGTILSINSSTPGAIIYYEIGGAEPTKSSNIYKSPFELKDNSIVKAFASAENYNDSEVATFNTSIFTCEEVTYLYDGRTITMNSATDGAVIYYTIDGNSPTTNSSKYNGSFILDGLCTIKAIATKDNTNDSQISTFATPCYYNKGRVYVQNSGSLSKAFEWTDISKIEKMDIDGSLNEEDINWIRNNKYLQHLNLKDVDIKNNNLPEEAFANMNIISITMPSSNNINIGNCILKNCKNLGAIKWNLNQNMPDDILGDITLPNLLVYANNASYISTKFTNVVVNGYADNITLLDDSISNFYCLEDFTARKICYTHNYTQNTVPNECMGWETIALPFDVQSINHIINGQISPFGTVTNDQKPFWLYTVSSQGFVPANKIFANIPYIISMPNYEGYADRYILAGTVTFSATNTSVFGIGNLVWFDKYIFTPNYVHTVSEGKYVLNVGEKYNGHNEGSVFVPQLRDVKPFEFYLTSIDGNAKELFYISTTETATSTEAIPIKDTKLSINVINGTITISSNTTRNISINNLNGMLVKIIKIDAGINYISDLPNGIYIIAGKKVTILK